MPFKGVLKSKTALTVQVTGAGGNADGCAVTVAFIVKRDQYKEVDTWTVGPGGNNSVTYTPGANQVRAVIDVSLCAGGNCLVVVSQGLNTFEDTITGDTTFTYDLVAP